MSKKNQCLNHLKSIGTLCSWQAISLFNVTRLAAYIFEFKKAGEFIISLEEKNPDTDTTFARYYCPEGLNDMEREELYKRVCKIYNAYPDGKTEKVKIGLQKEEMERRFPKLKTEAKK